MVSEAAIRWGLRALFKVSPALGVRAAAKLFSTPRVRPVSQKEAAILATGTALPLKAGLAATTWGEGETVLLVHGWERHRASLGAFVAPLVEAGRRVVAFDAPAHNDSPGRTANPVLFAEAMSRVAGELGPLKGIVGHSMGGGATLLALHEGVEAERVALLAPASDWDYQLRFFARYVGLSGVASEHFVRHIEKQAQRSLQTMSVQHLAPGLEQAFLLFHDPDDRRVPYRDSLALEAHLSNAELVSVKGLGHSNLLYDPMVIAQTIAFLS